MRLPPRAEIPDRGLMADLRILPERVAAPAALQDRLEPVAEVRARARDQDRRRGVVEGGNLALATRPVHGELRHLGAAQRHDRRCDP